MTSLASRNGPSVTTDRRRCRGGLQRERRDHGTRPDGRSRRAGRAPQAPPARVRPRRPIRGRTAKSRTQPWSLSFQVPGNRPAPLRRTAAANSTASAEAPAAATPALVGDTTTGGVGDAGALLSEFQSGPLGLGEDLRLPPHRDEVEPHLAFPSVFGVLGVHVGAGGAAVDLAGPDLHQ